MKGKRNQLKRTKMWFEMDLNFHYTLMCEIKYSR
jgi:hypothetical protein